MKDFVVVALVLLASSNLYFSSRLDAVKAHNNTLEAKLEATQKENDKLTQQILGMLSNK